MLSVRIATHADYPRIMDIYRSAQDFMISAGNPDQWGHWNPPPETVRSDIESGISHVVYDGNGIHGVFALLRGEDPTYRVIEDGAWPNDGPYITIHRIAGDGQTHGVFHAAFLYWKTVSDNIRIDTHEANRPMLRLILAHGFRRCGIIHIANGSPRIAFQYIKNPPPSERRPFAGLKTELFHPNAVFPETPLVLLPVFGDEAAGIYGLCTRLDLPPFTLAAVTPSDWESDFSPWPAPNLRPSDPPFAGNAQTFLRQLTQTVLPSIRAGYRPPDSRTPCYLAGYSLAGLFALWSGYESGAFDGVAAVSPSVWYPGFVPYATERAPKTRAVYLSLGDREENTRHPVLSDVGNAIRSVSFSLDRTEVRHVLEWNEGNHFRDESLRVAKGIAWLLRNACAPGGGKE